MKKQIVKKCKECGNDSENCLRVMFQIGRCNPTITPPICPECRKKFKSLASSIVVGIKTLNIFWEYDEKNKKWFNYEHYGFPEPDGMDSLEYWKRCCSIVSYIEEAKSRFICVQKGMTYPLGKYVIHIQKVSEEFCWFYIRGENIVKRLSKDVINRQVFKTLSDPAIKMKVGLQIKSGRANFVSKIKEVEDKENSSLNDLQNLYQEYLNAAQTKSSKES